MVTARRVAAWALMPAAGAYFAAGIGEPGAWALVVVLVAIALLAVGPLSRID